MPDIFVKSKKGYIMIMLLVFTGIFVTLLAAISAYVLSQSKASHFKVKQQQIMEIAEAGVNYYRWHLAHVPDDYTDGTGQPGPYIHDYKDINGNTVGRYSLVITPPQSGSTIVKIESTGYLLNEISVTKTIILKMGIPSFSNYAVVANDIMRFGPGTEIWGPVHSNQGIRFDGLAHNIISSSVAQYNDPDHTGPNEFGVHTHDTPVDPLPPAPVPNRTDIFAAGRTFPVPSVNFTGITADLSAIKTSAIANGIYLTASGVQGYHVVFNPNHTVSITKVNSQRNCSWRQSGTWYSYANVWSINTESSFNYQGSSSLNRPMPNNGLIFIEDDTWVDGHIDGDRVTVVAAREPLASANATIHLNNNLTYTHYDGTDSIGLIAQTDIAVGFYSADTLAVDAALIAQKGFVGRYYYAPHSGQQNPANCTSNVYRNQITLNGSLATYLRYGFAYTDGTGYLYRYLNFDPNLTYSPPPSFPTTGEYAVISWEEK